MRDSEDIYFDLINFNEDACYKLYEEFHALIWYLARSKINDIEVIKDLELEIYEKIILNTYRVKDPKKFRSYVCSIINHTILSKMREKVREQIEIIESEELELKIFEKEMNRERNISFDDVLEYLNEDERDIVYDYIVLQMPFRNIGNVLKMSEHKVRRKYNNAIKKIRINLDKEGYYVRPLQKDKINVTLDVVKKEEKEEINELE